MALIQGINLLVNMIKQLRADIVLLEDVFGDWQQKSTLGFENQVKIIFGTSADNRASLYLVGCISKLNKHKMHEFPYREYLVTLTVDCIDAVMRAIQAHSHIWNKVQLQTVLNALGTAHVTRGLPYYDNEEDEDKKKEQKKHIIGKNNGRD